MPDTVLVTGGAGFLGSHIVVELARTGFAPIILDNFSNSTPAIRSRLEALGGRPVPCITADVRDAAALRAAFHDHPITAVVHCAGPLFSSFGASFVSLSLQCVKDCDNSRRRRIIAIRENLGPLMLTCQSAFRCVRIPWLRQTLRL